MSHTTRFLVAAALGIAGLSFAVAPSPAAAAKFDAKGFFAANCAACHGAKGQGGMGPNLTKVEAKGDKFVTNRIEAGSPKGMPPFKGRLSAAEMKALVTYVKSL